ncbi:MAG: hypothetical protein UW41_C0008G0024 [Candidatus Collierbacteria bacterium GW2011_GWC2_44_18]|uniref:Glycosyltransferase RgtA/B/C/D-like domain-containing protein n=2 Tax=Microgenomates group TaxID=1794810 RepID=A0A0G1LG18_9BACT|nr:MAG: hypothetical protein UW16_C0007G0023 [Microgenomates group bacterium GW2011_GWC1_44_10]KKT49339.1 MAG: hypothetical protein UW41_C0008G0024 [Candidatus Collierbacteria bacterium GW2011_GWC2_44_18]KKT67617.1 MAG: hypothetical protein UW60_C0003G0025 [Candidatus Woesebacteria bacterium GW2011_GWA2_44_33]
MRHNKWLILGSIFILALLVRFYAFRESVYFGFDQARDAYISQDIFLKHDLRFIGPPVSGDTGLFHGPLFWYILGPIYLLLKGDPALVSGIFRILNALGVFLIFGISGSLFGPLVGYIAALFYAVSYEQSQYSLYVGNPALGVLSMMLIFLGAVQIYKNSKYAKWSPLLMLGGAAFSMQMNLMFVYTFAIVATLLFLLRTKIGKIATKFWLWGIALMGLLLSTFLLVELKYNFRSFRLAFTMLKAGYGVMDATASKYILFLNKEIVMYRDNVLATNNQTALRVLVLFVSVWVLYQAIKNKNFQILAVWLFGWIFLMILGGHTAYYTNAGLGTAVIIAVAILIEKINNINKYLAIIYCGLIIWGNLNMIRAQSPNSLIQEMITQQSMKLADEYRVIDEMYTIAEGKGFTVRMTGVPYNIQTVWAYLFHQYGLPKYGYLPFWEVGNVLAFPGAMPIPKSGSTCIRFLGREPMHGLPQVLVDNDEGLEKKFSIIVDKKNIGSFTLETRMSIDADCHDNRP